MVLLGVDWEVCKDGELAARGRDDKPGHQYVATADDLSAPLQFAQNHRGDWHGRLIALEPWSSGGSHAPRSDCWRLQKKGTADLKGPWHLSVCFEKGNRRLDDVDFGRKIARNLETNFLLANLRLVPDFHCVFLSIFEPARLRQSI